MSNSDFDRAVNFLQGAIDTAARSTPSDQQLPGFELPDEPASAEPVQPEPEEIPPVRDPFAPPPEAIAPPLPGMATPPPLQGETDLPPMAQKTSSLELHPPAKKRASLTAVQGQPAERKPVIRITATTILAALSGVLGLGLVAACVCLLRSPETPVETVPAGIPLALLPETADPSLWETVSGMSGEIDGAFLTFERGLATDTNGRSYRLMLDFCRSGNDIYAKVTGDKTYVVRLDDLGKIIKAYPAPKNKKPLKEIFGK